MARRFRLLLFLAALTGAMAVIPRAGAQTPANDPRVALTQDTLAARLVMASVLGELGFAIAQAARDTTSRPWMIEIPLAGTPEWSKYRDYLFHILRARPPNEQDRFVQTLFVTSLQMQGDTLVAQFSVGQQWRCYNVLTGAATSFEMRARRSATSAEGLRTRVVEYTDGRTCVVAPPAGP